MLPFQLPADTDVVFLLFHADQNVAQGIDGKQHDHRQDQIGQLFPVGKVLDHIQVPLEQQIGEHLARDTGQGGHRGEEPVAVHRGQYDGHCDGKHQRGKDAVYRI